MIKLKFHHYQINVLTLVPLGIKIKRNCLGMYLVTHAGHANVFIGWQITAVDSKAYTDEKNDINHHWGTIQTK